jgi:hypothetical protein
MSAVLLVGVSVLLLALATLRTVAAARRVELVPELALAVPIAQPVTDVLIAAPKTSPPRI